MIHMPSRSSQKYPRGLLLTIVVPCTLLLSLPSMAVRLVANRQSCRRPGVATRAVPSGLVTGKQGLVGRLGSCMKPQGVGAKVPLGKTCFSAAYASKFATMSCARIPRGFWEFMIEIGVSPTVREKEVSKSAVWLVRKARIEMNSVGEPLLSSG